MLVLSTIRIYPFFDIKKSEETNHHDNKGDDDKKRPNPLRLCKISSFIISKPEFKKILNVLK
jgi:hypothetical protein